MKSIRILILMMLLLTSTVLFASIRTADMTAQKYSEETAEPDLMNMSVEASGNIAELTSYLKTTKYGGTVRHSSIKGGAGWAGTLKWYLQDVETLGYCVEMNMNWCPNKDHKYAADLSSPEVVWILNNFYPNNPNQPAELSSVSNKAEAVQLAIWHFTDNIDISSGGSPSTVFDAARRIIAAAQTQDMSPVPAKLMVEVTNTPMWMNGEQTVTVTVFDQNGAPMNGVNVDVDITGENTLFSSVTTGANGQGFYRYTGTTAGEDKVKAHIGFTVLPGFTWDRASSCQTMIQALPAAAELTAKTSFKWSSFCPIDLATPQTSVWSTGQNDVIVNSGLASVEINLVWEWETLDGSRVEYMRQSFTLAPGLKYNVDYPETQDWKAAGPASIVVDTDTNYEIWNYKMHLTATVNECNLFEICGEQDFAWVLSFSERKLRIASLGDYVWWDTNANGVQENDEPGIGGVVVKLFSSAGQLADETTTATDGSYLFESVIIGDYNVQFVAPSGFVASPSQQAASDVDSDADANGFTMPVTLAGGGVNLTIDAGFFKKIIPHTLCMSVEGDVLRAKLGYTNPNPKSITVPMGPENGFIGGNTSDMGQPIVFLSGQHGFSSPESFLIQTPVNGALIWNLCGTQQPINENLSFGDSNLQAAVSFTADTQFGIGSVTVQFNNTSTNSSDYLWDFGDGTTSNEENPVHVYGSQKKYYTVSLTCLACGTDKHIVRENFITVVKPSHVNFAAAPIAGKIGTEVAFENNSGGLANIFEWDFGDGSSAIYQHDYKNTVNPRHTYTQAGEYDVTLTASGQGGVDELIIPGMIYIDAEHDYLNLNLVEGGGVLDNYGWENIIDHDVYGQNGKVVAYADDAEAIFEMNNEAVAEVHKVRLLVESLQGAAWPTNLAKRIEILASMDGETFVPVFSGEITARKGEWSLFELVTPFSAQYIKVVLPEARGEFAGYIELVELQLFGEEVSQSSALFRNKNGEDVLIPEIFGLAQNYPNPFNPETQISFSMPEEGFVRLTIYNMYGQVIETLVNETTSAGMHQVTWNAQNDLGMSVATGVYIYHLQVVTNNGQGLNFTKRMTLVK